MTESILEMSKLKETSPEDLLKIFKMNKYQNRLESFKDIWPFTSNSKCTPENVGVFKNIFFLQTTN